VTPEQVNTWLAGLMDGEGTIVMLRMMKDRPGAIAGRILLSNSCKPLLDKVQERVQAGKIRLLKGHHTPLKQNKPMFTWTLHGVNAGPILKKIRPHLIVKANRADLVLLLLETFTSDSNSHKLDEKTIVIREMIFEKWQKLRAAEKDTSEEIFGEEEEDEINERES